MKRKSRVITIWSLLLCSLFGAHAQNGNYKGAERYSKFVKRTMLVVLDDIDSEYNRQMTQAITTYWKATPFEFILNEDIQKYLRSDEHALLIATDRKVNYAGMRGRAIKQEHSDIALLLCERDSIQHMPGHFEVSSIEIMDVHDTASFNYKLPILIQSMQHYLGFLANAGTMDRDQHAKKLTKYTNLQRKKVGERIVLVCKDDLGEEDLTSERLLKLYGEGIEIVDKNRIRKAIADQEEGVALLHIADRDRDLTILDINGGLMLYNKPLIERGKIGAEDIEKLVKACK